MDTLETALRSALQCEIHFDAIHRRVYSIDASIYEIEPIGIIIPKTTSDLLTALRISSEHHIPVIARGAATGITGGCIGKGLIIDTSKYLNEIIEINYEQQYAICQPGVVQDRLNEALFVKGYRLGPDTSTGNRATLGGMIANNAAGARSLYYGTMADHILEIDLALTSGEVIHLEALDDAAWDVKQKQLDREGQIYRDLYKIKEKYQEEIATSFPHIPRRVSGYNLEAFTPFNPCKLIAGSEGTLGIATQIKVKICKRAAYSGLCIITFKAIQSAIEAVTTMLQENPVALELIDHAIIAAGLQSPSMRGKLEWLEGNPDTLIVAEFFGGTYADVESKLNQFADCMRQKKIGQSHILLMDSLSIDHVWALRKAGLGLLLSKRSYSRAIAFIEDISIPPSQLASFMLKFCGYLKSIGKEAGIYGHVGSGCMHVRPYIDLHYNSERQLMKKIMQDVSDMLLEHGGALSGEHGDGLVRSWLNKKMFGEKLYHAFLDIKKAFDPSNLMNPSKIVHGHPLLENLRPPPKTSIKTFLDFSSEGGFELAVDLCNGNGLCRKSEKVMCPSFQATGDEFHTTRARAQALRDVINGRMAIRDFTSKGMFDVLDLCLECKGCKTECPSEVDMAKMKAEFLYHYHQEHGGSLRNTLFANIGRINELTAPFATIFNALADTQLAKAAFEWIGIAPERGLPQLAKQRFSSWFRSHPSAKHRQKVVLYNDTFTEFNHPHIGQAAVKVLEGMGYHVIVPPWKCCGRPAISKGYLPYAQKMALKVVAHLAPYAQAGIPIIGLEPSCLLTIKDDFHGLLPENKQLKAVVEACITFDEFVAQHLDQLALLQFKENNQVVKLHGHCHQKALVGTQPTLNVLKAIPGYSVTEIDSGCCGLAGSFGYEAEHYELSMKIGELKLFPAIRQASQDTLLVADGFSCRCQIAHGTQRTALHLAEAIAARL